MTQNDLTPLNVQVTPLPQELQDLPEVDLIAMLPDAAGLKVWFGPGVKLLGWGEAAKLKFDSAHPIEEAARDWEKLAAACTVKFSADDPAQEQVAQRMPIAFGSFGFSSKTTGYLVVPTATLALLEEGKFLITAGTGDPESLVAPMLDQVQKQVLEEPAGLWTDPGQMTQGQWKDAVRRLVQLLKSGAASKVVLTRDMVVSAATKFDERFLLSRLAQLYPTTWVYAVEGLIGATPEMLAAMDGEDVISRVLAGTFAPGEETKLLESHKDRQEHNFAVESVVRELDPLAEEMVVPKEPKLLTLPNVIHLCTDVEAVVRDGNLLDVVDALHPTAAVCGTPTELAFDILEATEKTERGRYSGPVGWIDASGSGEFGIALRCGQLNPDHKTIRLFAGGGIMPDSIPEVELVETRAKMRPLLDALGLDD